MSKKRANVKRVVYAADLNLQDDKDLIVLADINDFLWMIQFSGVKCIFYKPNACYFFETNAVYVYYLKDSESIEEVKNEFEK